MYSAMCSSDRGFASDGLLADAEELRGAYGVEEQGFGALVERGHARLRAERRD
jgi:hypothetical protein